MPSGVASQGLFALSCSRLARHCNDNRKTSPGVLVKSYATAPPQEKQHQGRRLRCSLYDHMIIRSYDHMLTENLENKNVSASKDQMSGIV